VISAYLHDSHIQSKFFAVAISTILTGFLLIIFHKNVFTHLVGYLVMENGIFILSLAVGNEMPMMINAAILLDIFIGILVLGLFLNRVGDAFKGTETEFLSQLKD
jgi:hydrogenase-4 component E